MTQHFQLKIDDEAITRCGTLLHIVILVDGNSPDKAISVLDTAAARVALEPECATCKVRSDTRHNCIISGLNMRF